MSAGPLWTVAEMAAAMGAERQGVLPSAISGISIDSRSIAPGEAFFALAARRDGYEFVDAALMAKAGLAVIAAERRGQMRRSCWYEMCCQHCATLLPRHASGRTQR
jgi:UDP-N-acetylmuramoyl-tripeptide--D-alanyl-D-alanine ligase